MCTITQEHLQALLLHVLFPDRTGTPPWPVHLVSIWPHVRLKHTGVQNGGGLDSTVSLW